MEMKKAWAGRGGGCEGGKGWHPVHPPTGKLMRCDGLSQGQVAGREKPELGTKLLTPSQVCSIPC